MEDARSGVETGDDCPLVSLHSEFFISNSLGLISEKHKRSVNLIQTVIKT